MNETVKNQIRGLSGMSDDVLQSVFDSWETYFTNMEIPDGKQEQEFDAITRARAKDGSISLIAPNLTKLFGRDSSEAS